MAAADPSTLIAKALSHPLRVTALVSMSSPKRRMSPKQLSEETGEALVNCAYHCRQLRDFGMIELVETQQVRGATQHFYGLVERPMFWSSSLGKTPPVIRQIVASTDLGSAVESIGKAIDAGTFDKRPDAQISHQILQGDSLAWSQMVEILKNAQAQLAQAEQEAVERAALQPGLATFPVSYLTACWEPALAGEAAPIATN